jgi:nicotinamidase-related amidase
MRGERNSDLYEPLQASYIKGQQAGTDVWVHKNRMSALWGNQTSLDLYLKENGITTLLLSGEDANGSG